jgi:hypothetical protein
MNASLKNRVRCAFFGHDWRQAIGPRQGHYLRCGRCWASEDEGAPQHADAEDANVPQAWRPGELSRQA